MKKKENGFVLIIVAFLVLLSSLVVVGIMNTNRVNVQQLSIIKDDMRAYYVACAGVEDAIANLRNAKNYSGILDVIFPPGSDCIYTVETTNQSTTATIIASGRIGIIEKQIKVIVSIGKKKVDGLYPVEINSWEEN